MQPIIDNRASREQVDAVFRILKGEETEPGATVFNVFQAVIDTRCTSPPSHRGPALRHPSRAHEVRDQDRLLVISDLFLYVGNSLTNFSKLTPAVVVRCSEETGSPSSSWGLSTRGLGILNNELYIGRRVWNRQRFIKDPTTGRRRARRNAPELMLIDEVPGGPCGS